MKCNIPRPTKPRDIARLNEELCKIRCRKCGAVIEECTTPILAIYEAKRMKLCDKCKGGTDEIQQTR